MTISVTCLCGAPYRLRAEAAGKQFRCRECGEPITVPAESRETRASSRSQEAFEDYGDVPEPFEGGVEHAGELPAAPAGRGHQFVAQKGRHRVVLSACETSMVAIAESRLQNACDDLLNYLAASPKIFKRSSLRLVVRSDVINPEDGDVKIRISGTVNDRQVSKTFEGSVRNYGDASMMVAGGLLGYLVHKLFQRTLQAAMPNRPHRGLQQEFTKIRHQLFDVCDKAVGRKGSPMSGRWLGIQIGSGIAALLAFVGAMLYVKAGGGTAGKGAMIGVFLVVPVAFLVLAAGLVVMPDTFFRSDAAGRRALRLSGAGTPTGARINGAVSAVILLALSLGLLIILGRMK